MNNVTNNLVTKDKTYIVYMHRNKINLKMYIGTTSQDPYMRWGKNGSHYIKHKYFYKEIKEYGWDNFYHYILYTNLTKEEAFAKEIELIAFYNTTNPLNGYNKHPGGELILNQKEHIEHKLREKKKKKSEPVYRPFKCTYDNKVFNTKKEASLYYHIPIGNIRAILGGLKKSIIIDEKELSFEYIKSP